MRGAPRQRPTQRRTGGSSAARIAPECRVTQLGYLGIEVSDLPSWEQFATKILGLEPNATPDEEVVHFRLDENHHRLALRAGALDDLTSVGWETSDEGALRSIADRLETDGHTVTWGTEAEARDRRVMGLITTTDPSGLTTEIYFGPLVLAERPFRSPLRNLDDIGSTYDLCHDHGVPIASTLGCHTNDKMVSFYMQTPSGFQVEYGHGGRMIDDSTWEVQLHQAPSIWGHRAPTVVAFDDVGHAK